MKKTTQSVMDVTDETLEVTEKVEPKKTEIIVEASRLNVREKPKAGANIIAVVEKGKTFEAVKANEDWFKILINGTTGYVLANFVSVK